MLAACSRQVRPADRQGHIASVTNLVDRACYLAITTGAETITADLLADTTTDNAASTLSRTL